MALRSMPRSRRRVCVLTRSFAQSAIVDSHVDANPQLIQCRLAKQNGSRFTGEKRIRVFLPRGVNGYNLELPPQMKLTQGQSPEAGGGTTADGSVPFTHAVSSCKHPWFQSGSLRLSLERKIL